MKWMKLVCLAGIVVAVLSAAAALNRFFIFNARFADPNQVVAPDAFIREISPIINFMSACALGVFLAAVMGIVLWVKKRKTRKKSGQQLSFSS